jgi:hypothetical protein
MYMRVYHVPTLRDPVPCHHGVVVERDFVRPVADFSESIHTLKETSHVCFLHPFLVVIADDEAFFAAEPHKVLLGVDVIAKEEVAQDVHRVRRFDGAIPVFDECLVHLFHARKRPTAVTDDVMVPKMLITGEKYHTETSAFLGNFSKKSSSSICFQWTSIFAPISVHSKTFIECLCFRQSMLSYGRNSTKNKMSTAKSPSKTLMQGLEPSFLAFRRYETVFKFILSFYILPYSVYPCKHCEAKSGCYAA